MENDIKKVPINRGYRLNRDYFVSRFKVLGDEGMVKFIREEAKYWTHPVNLTIAKIAYKEMTGKELPAITDAERIEELQKENERLKAEQESKTKVKMAEPVPETWTHDDMETATISANEEEPAVEKMAYTTTNSGPRKRGKKVGS